VRRHERALVVLIALHSVAVGVGLLFLTEFGARIGGFGTVTPLSSRARPGPSTSVAASAYLIEYFRYRGILILLTTKSIAVVFLGVMTALGGMPWIVPFSGVADGLMGLLAFLVHRAARREAAREEA